MENINAAAKECLGQKTADDRDLGMEIQRNGLDLSKKISTIKNSNDNWKNMFSKIDTNAIEETLNSDIRKKLEIARSSQGDKKFEACVNIVAAFPDATLALSNKKSADAYTKKAEATLDPALVKKQGPSSLIDSARTAMAGRHKQIEEATK